MGKGNVPLAVRPFYFGTNLITLNKKGGGGARLIAVGNTLCRLVAKCFSSQVLDKVSAYLLPLQLGYGISRGAEAIVHSVRCFLQQSNVTQSVFKLDFQNTFNSLRRDRMLQVVSEVVPELYSFVHAAYGSPTSLFHGESTILSQEGVQQGDPLGPMIFCVTIHPMLQISEPSILMMAPWEALLLTSFRTCTVHTIENIWEAPWAFISTGLKHN